MHTALAQYECGKPTAPYRKLLEPLLAQVELVGAVHKAMCPAAGGRLDASFEDVSCRVARTKVHGNHTVWRWGFGALAGRRVYGMSRW